MRYFDAFHVPQDGWTEYRKKANTRAMRIYGPFVVHTTEGPVRCEDGYLAIDAHGYPYPIDKDEFRLIYEEVSNDRKEW